MRLTLYVSLIIYNMPQHLTAEGMAASEQAFVLTPRGVVLVAAVGGGHQRAGVNDQHLVAPEPLGQQLISIGGTAPGRGRANAGERQPPPPRSGL